MDLKSIIRILKHINVINIIWLAVTEFFPVLTALPIQENVSYCRSGMTQCGIHCCPDVVEYCERNMMMCEACVGPCSVYIQALESFCWKMCPELYNQTMQSLGTTTKAKTVKSEETTQQIPSSQQFEELNNTQHGTCKLWN